MADFAEILRRRDPTGGDRRPRAGLCLSGGGFRAMLFHAGALRRLHEIDALRHIDRISSVSGGSISAALLGLRWDELQQAHGDIAAFERLIQEPLFDFAGQRIDAVAIGLALVTPGVAVSDRVTAAYRDLFGDATLSQLPSSPRFVVLATNLGSGALVRFSSSYTADYRVGVRFGLDRPLADVVAASSAFPPLLSPKVIHLEDDEALTDRFIENGDEAGEPPTLARKPWTHRLELTDGGVYDNLGLQPLESFATILASDGGGPFKFEERVSKNWLQHMIRAWKVADNQVRALRRSDLVGELLSDQQLGAYWGINSDITKYEIRAIDVDPSWIPVLAAVPTRLGRFSKRRRRLLVNWGYVVADAAIRSHVTNDVPRSILPYPNDPLDGPVPEPSLLRRLFRRPPV